jgi:hypothetical protein
MTSALTSALTWTKEGDRISLVGRIDENADLNALAAEIPWEGATVDLSGLTRINSIGVREWMDFVSSLAPRPVRLERCAPVFVEQLNAIANFTGQATLVSVMSAFECEHDGNNVNIEVKIDDARKNILPAAPTCSRCGAEMIPAQENDLYYRFLRYTPRG